MKLLEWEVPEDNYQEQIIIPKAIRDMAGRIPKKSDIYSFNVLNGNGERQIGFEKF